MIELSKSDRNGANKVLHSLVSVRIRISYHNKLIKNVANATAKRNKGTNRTKKQGNNKKQ